MFKESELRLIGSAYFIILKLNSFCITLRSKNTGHFWHIVVQEYGKVRRFELYHRHKETDEYHLHGHAKNAGISATTWSITIPITNDGTATGPIANTASNI